MASDRWWRVAPVEMAVPAVPRALVAPPVQAAPAAVPGMRAPGVLAATVVQVPLAVTASLPVQPGSPADRAALAVSVETPQRVVPTVPAVTAAWAEPEGSVAMAVFQAASAAQAETVVPAARPVRVPGLQLLPVTAATPASAVKAATA